MGISRFLAAGLCLVPVVLGAQEARPIGWSSERSLRRADFQGRPPVAATNASMSWLEIDASWECEDGKLVATVRAVFHPARSWWRTSPGSIWGDSAGVGDASRAQLEARRSAGQRDAQLLAHEQLHFDLTELAARRIRNRFEEFKDACSEPGGTEPLRRLVTEIDRELQEEQRRYDRETANGVNAQAQDQWRRRIDPLVRSPVPAAPPR